MRINKKDALFIRGCVISCDAPDLTEDIAPSKKETKEIFTNYFNPKVDVNHSWIESLGVYTLENTLLEHDSIISKVPVKAGSWITSMMITSPSIKKLILEGKLDGLSLGAVTDDALPELALNKQKNDAFLNKSLKYTDIKDMESLSPIFVSIVKDPANNIPLEVYSYDSYLAKSKNEFINELTKLEKGDDKLTENRIEMSESLFGKILGYLTKSNSDAEIKPGEPKLTPQVKEKIKENKEGESLEAPKEEVNKVPKEELKPKQEPPVKEVKISKEDEAEAEADAEKPVEPEAVVKEAEPVILSQESIDAVAEAVIMKLQALAAQEEIIDEAEDELDKACGSDDEVDKACGSKDDEVAKAETEPVAEEVEKSVEPSAKEHRLNKSTTKGITEETPAPKEDTFLNSATRDEFGRNINYLRS